MKKFSILVIALFSLLLVTKTAEAKVLPQAAKVGKQIVGTKSTGTSINVSPKFRADRKAVIVNFSNLQTATSVSYTFTYTQNGQQEGAIGTLNLDKSSVSQELLFGTCSKNVCRYHTNISNVKLEVSYTLKSGKKYVKRYKLKM